MCHKDTIGRHAAHRGRGARSAGAIAALLLATGAFAQTATDLKPGFAPDWRRIGNYALELRLAAPASGPVERAWFSQDGSRLYVRTGSGVTFETADYEKWRPAAAEPPAEPGALATPASAPPGSFLVRSNPANPARLYSLGSEVQRSDDGGQSWESMTTFRKISIIGRGMHDLAVSPRDPDEIVVTNDQGVWRSLDGGVTWAGLNDMLPNLPATRFAGTPQGTRGVRLAAGALGVIEWAPGEKEAWRPADDAAHAAELAARRSAAEALGVAVTAFRSSGDYQYAGAADGRIWVSYDRGTSWLISLPAGPNPVNDIFVDAVEPRVAVAALGGAKGPHVLRTMNGGQFWEDATSDLPEGAANGVTADRSSGTIYAATDRGTFFMRTNLNASAAGNWTALAGLPQAKAVDVKLDADGNQLYVVIQGYGVYAAMAPHRLVSLRLVNAADFSQRAAAPGSLLSVLGGRVRSARAGDIDFPILAASDSETQIQVPYTIRGPIALVSLDSVRGSLSLPLSIENVSPAIFVDSRDGTPMVLNADTGLLVDATTPVHSGGRLQILATGLGKVNPDWPAGMAGPLENPPRVAAQVHAYVNYEPVEVTRAVLAPGYVGLYLVEVQLPTVVNAGPATLRIEAEGHASNAVRIWLDN
jgi:uncharacterized protein (TIGR03437 family)